MIDQTSEKMAQQWRAQTAVPGEPGSVSSAHIMRAHTAFWWGSTLCSYRKSSAAIFAPEGFAEVRSFSQKSLLPVQGALAWDLLSSSRRNSRSR